VTVIVALRNSFSWRVVERVTRFDVQDDPAAAWTFRPLSRRSVWFRRGKRGKRSPPPRALR
jgi:hypothetical protein